MTTPPDHSPDDGTEAVSETTGFIESLDTPRPARAVGEWSDVWDRQQPVQGGLVEWLRKESTDLSMAAGLWLDVPGPTAAFTHAGIVGSAAKLAQAADTIERLQASTPRGDVEAVAWRWRYDYGDGKVHWKVTQTRRYSQAAAMGCVPIIAEPLYLTPPAALPLDQERESSSAESAVQRTAVLDPDRQRDLEYAQSLVLATACKHYGPPAGFAPVDGMYGLLMQLDNMLCGLERSAESSAADDVASEPRLDPEVVERVKNLIRWAVARAVGTPHMAVDEVRQKAIAELHSILAGARHGG